jgi:hypothetical protein
MLIKPCPLPVGREKAPLTKDERLEVSTRMRNVIAERKAQFDYVNNLDDAAVTKSLQTAQNKVQTAENKVNSLQKRLNDISTSTQGVKDKHNVYKAEVKARDESIAAEARIEEGIAKLDEAFFKANSDVDPKLIKAYEKAFNAAKYTTEPVMLKQLDGVLNQLEKGLEAEAKGVTKEIEKLWSTREGQLRSFNVQQDVTRKANNRISRAEKKLIAEVAKADKTLSKELDQALKQYNGSKQNYDALVDVSNRYENIRKKNQADQFEVKTARDEFFVKLGEAVDLDPRKGRGVLDWMVSKLGYTLDGIAGMRVAADVRLGLQRSGYLAENAVNSISDIISVKTLIDFRRDFAKAADSLGISPKQRQILMTETIEKGQIPEFLNWFDPNNSVVRKVQLQRYDEYQRGMFKAGFTITQIDEFVNRSVHISKIADDVRKMGKAFGVNIDTLEPFLGYMTRVFSLDGNIWRRRIVDAEAKSGNILPVGKDAKFKFDIARKYDFLVPQDLELATDILKVSQDDLMKLIDDPLQMKLFIEKNLTPSQIDTLVDLGFFQKLPMSTRDVYDYLMAQYRLPFSNAADMFSLDPVANMQKYARAIGDQANISMMLTRILDEDGVRLGWSIPQSLYETDKLLPASQRQFANFVKMEDKMLEWTSRLGITADMQESLAKVVMHPVVADQVTAILDITKSPALLGQMGGAIGWFNNLFAKLKQGNLVANAPVYLANQVRGNYLQMHAAGANILLWTPSANDVWRVVRGEGLDHIDNTIKRYSIDGKELTERELFMWTYDNHGTATTSIFGERGRPSAFVAKDAARNILSNSSASVWHLMQYMFGTGELTGGKALNSMERVLGGVDYFLQKSSGVINDLSAPVFYTANMVDFTAKYTTIRSTAKRIDGGSILDKGATYMFSQSVKSFDNTSAINAHLRAYFPDMRDVGSLTYSIDKYAIMYFSWQAGMLPRVLRDVVRRPWRYAASEKLRQLTAEPLKEDGSITEAGISPDILKGMPYYIGRGKDDGKLVFWNDSSYNPTTATFEFLRETAGANETTADRRAKMQGDFRSPSLVRAMQSTYAPAKIIYELTSNTNLRTGNALRRVDGKGLPLLGFSVPPELFSVINNAIPYAGALDRLDIEALSGTPQITDNNGTIIQQGRAGLGGAVPDATGRVLRSKEIDSNWAYRILGTIGGNLRVVDMAKQNKISYNDVSRSLDLVTKQLDREKESLLSDQRSGSIKNTKSYQERVQAMEKLLVTRTQLQIDEDRIYLWLRERGTLTDAEIKKKEMYLNQLQQKGVSPIDAAISNQAQQLLKFRQEWSIPRYGKGKETSP